ncbi:hypothetical protein P7K49_034117 [Saguinus oedipus]|uniref:Uncharacterized protein n=1 Tax=Saguinus oedipus TaxID=9490 RepID=A0ABQ9TUL6_SAGOE|nr:hypothetical protein P7K49_034117 [Saguinus oedipus]
MHVLLEIWEAGGVCGGRAGEGAAEGAVGAQVKRGRRQVPGESCGGEKDLQHSAGFHRARRFYRLRVDRPGGNTEVGGQLGGRSPPSGQEGPTAGQLPALRFQIQSLPLRNPGGPGKGVLGTSPLPPKPAVSPNSRRMELRKVPSSSSGSPVLGRQKQRDFGMERGRGCPSRNHPPSTSLLSQTGVRRPRYGREAGSGSARSEEHPGAA